MSDLRDQVHQIVTEAWANFDELEAYRNEPEVYTDRIMKLIEPASLTLCVGDRVVTMNPERHGSVTYPGSLDCLVRFDVGYSAWIPTKNLKMES